MRTPVNTTNQSVTKEVKEETVNFLDRHINHWFIDSETNELKIGSNFSDFVKGKTENFKIKKIHLCDVKSWKFVETTDGKFVFLTSKKIFN
jgi:hypothetical protein